jgi:hypothetical protein
MYVYIWFIYIYTYYVHTHTYIYTKKIIILSQKNYKIDKNDLRHTEDTIELVEENSGIKLQILSEWSKNIIGLYSFLGCKIITNDWICNA